MSLFKGLRRYFLEVLDVLQSVTKCGIVFHARSL